MAHYSRVRGVAKLFAGIALSLTVIGLGALAWLATQPIPGAREELSVFPFEADLAIERTGPDGVRYTVNNSTATFWCDLDEPDQHGESLFQNYAAALRHCRESKLELLVSVQMVQGACKQVDDRVSAALECAVQRGVPGQRWLGKRRALEQLAGRLLGARQDLAGNARDAIDHAIVHVASALALFGVAPEMPATLVAQRDARTQLFLADGLKSRPIGFWSQSGELAGIFRQDRFLSGGLSLKDEFGAAVAIAWAIASDPDLADAFDQLARFDAAITGALVYVSTRHGVSEQGRLVGWRELIAALPHSASLAELLTADSLSTLGEKLVKTYGASAGAALVSYSQSKEFSLLHRLASSGVRLSEISTMGALVDAITSGAVTLAPSAGAGWYDYQLHALETLLLPDRGRESNKLRFTENYRQRMRNAFATILTKQRETQIKHLPILTFGSSLSRKEVPEVEIAPAFSVEPLPTVYLRLARAYRFVETAMAATLGDGALASITVDASSTGTRSVQDELRRAWLVLYGLCELIAPEIGQRVQYLEEELAAADIAAAREAARAWLASLEIDVDMASDTRVTVPVFNDGVQTRYWATGGVRLERVVYRYRQHPYVNGHVRTVFVPGRYYAPTDVFLEYARPGDPPTRDEFRGLCDAARTERALRTMLGASELYPASYVPWTALLVLVLAAAAAALAYRYRVRLRAVDWATLFSRRRRRIACAVLGGLFAVWLLLMLFSAHYRTEFLVRHIVPLNDNLAIMYEYTVFRWSGRAGRESALGELMGDADPQVRYVAAEFLRLSVVYGHYESHGPGAPLEAVLHRAIDDPVPEVQELALGCFAAARSPASVDLIINRLAKRKHRDAFCIAALWALCCQQDPCALSTILEFTHDVRANVRRSAVGALWSGPEERVLPRLLEMIEAEEDNGVFAIVARATENPSTHTSSPEWGVRLHDALTSAACDPSRGWEVRCSAAESIHRGSSRRPRPGESSEERRRDLEAVQALLSSPGVCDEAETSRRRVDAVQKLASWARGDQAAMSVLEGLLLDPDPTVRDAAQRGLERSRPVHVRRAQ